MAERTTPRRGQLAKDAILGFVGFFTFLAVVQAVINVFRPDPEVWPALFALVMLAACWLTWRLTRARPAHSADKK